MSIPQSIAAYTNTPINQVLRFTKINVGDVVARNIDCSLLRVNGNDVTDNLESTQNQSATAGVTNFTGVVNVGNLSSAGYCHASTFTSDGDITQSGGTASLKSVTATSIGTSGNLTQTGGTTHLLATDVNGNLTQSSGTATLKNTTVQGTLDVTALTTVNSLTSNGNISQTTGTAVLKALTVDGLVSLGIIYCPTINPTNLILKNTGGDPYVDLMMIGNGNKLYIDGVSKVGAGPTSNTAVVIRTSVAGSGVQSTVAEFASDKSTTFRGSIVQIAGTATLKAATVDSLTTTGAITSGSSTTTTTTSKFLVVENTGGDANVSNYITGSNNKIYIDGMSSVGAAPGTDTALVVRTSVAQSGVRNEVATFAADKSVTFTGNIVQTGGTSTLKALTVDGLVSLGIIYCPTINPTNLILKNTGGDPYVSLMMTGNANKIYIDGVSNVGAQPTSNTSVVIRASVAGSGVQSTVAEFFSDRSVTFRGSIVQLAGTSTLKTVGVDNLTSTGYVAASTIQSTGDFTQNTGTAALKAVTCTTLGPSGNITQSGGTTSLKATTVDSLTVTGAQTVGTNLGVSGNLTVTGSVTIGSGGRALETCITGNSGDVGGLASYEIPFSTSSGTFEKIEINYFRVRPNYSGTVTPTPYMRMRLCTTAGTPISSGYSVEYSQQRSTTSVSQYITTDMPLGQGGDTYRQYSGTVTITRGLLGTLNSYNIGWKSQHYSTNDGSHYLEHGMGHYSNTNQVVSAVIDITTASTGRFYSYSSPDESYFTWKIYYN